MWHLRWTRQSFPLKIKSSWSRTLEKFWKPPLENVRLGSLSKLYQCVIARHTQPNTNKLKTHSSWVHVRIPSYGIGWFSLPCELLWTLVTFIKFNISFNCFQMFSLQMSIQIWFFRKCLFAMRARYSRGWYWRTGFLTNGAYEHFR